MSQLLLPKKNLGLNMWSLVAKVRALNARWGLHYTTKRLSPDLHSLMHSVYNSNKVGRIDKDKEPLEFSGSLPGTMIKKITGSRIMAYLMDNWSRIVTRCPIFKIGDEVKFAYEDGSVWDGIGTITTEISESCKYVVEWEENPRQNPRVIASTGRCKAAALYSSDPDTITDTHNTVGIETDHLVMVSLRNALKKVPVKSTKHGPAFDKVEVNKHLYVIGMENVTF
jgi:hypothetical protein